MTRKILIALIAFVSLLASDAAAAPVPMTYHNGPVMTAPINLYYIWYGPWTNTGAQTVLTNFAKDVGGSPWFNSATAYYDSTGAHVPNAVSFAGSTVDNASLGTAINADQIGAIVTTALTKATNPLPADPNGLYVVLTAASVTVANSPTTGTDGLCVTNTCGFHSAKFVTQNHTSFSIKYAYIPDYTVQCPQICKVQTVSPNGNVVGDALANWLGHELIETATDPTSTGWYGQNPNQDENGDRCSLVGGPTYVAPGCNGAACANVHMGSHDYLIQQSFTQIGASGSGHGACASHFLRRNDIVQRDTAYFGATGDLFVMRTNGATAVQTKVGNVPLVWNIVGLEDFDGDGNGDILWRNGTSGDVYLWTMRGPTPLTGVTIATALPLNWRTIGTGDFDGDGNGDILWRDVNTGNLVIWFMKGTTFLSSAALVTAMPSFMSPDAVGDFNGDGRSDIVWRNYNNGDVSIWIMNGSTITSATGVVRSSLPTVWQVYGAGDFDGDGKSDLLLRNNSTSDVQIWLQNGIVNRSATTVKAAWSGFDLAGIGDFDGNGKFDVMWRNTSTHDWVTWRMNGAAIAQTLTTSKAGPNVGPMGAFSEN